MPIVGRPEGAGGVEPKADPKHAARDPTRHPRSTSKSPTRAGKVIRKFKGPAKLGVNRTSWDLRRDAFKRPPMPGEEPSEFRPRTGPEILAGHVHRHDQVPRQRGEADRARPRRSARRRSPPNSARRSSTPSCAPASCTETITAAIERIQKTRADIDSVSSKLKKDDDAARQDPRSAREIRHAS